MLTIDAGVPLQFDSSEWLQIGQTTAGGLIITGTVDAPVILESSKPEPTSGKWLGVYFDENTLSATSIDHLIVRHAGMIAPNFATRRLDSNVMHPALVRLRNFTSICILFACTGLSLACKAAPASAPLVEELTISIGTQLPISSTILGEPRTLSVFLPWSYDQRQEPFPVLYLIDGGPEQDFMPVAGLAALASLSAQYREFIVIGVETFDRRYELTTPSQVAYDLQQIPKNGGADDFRRFIHEEVQPLIESRYRTTGERLVLGESLAGLFIVDTFLRSPETFDMYIAVSPSLWWRQAELAKSASNHLQASFPTGKSLYIASADEPDILAGIDPLARALRAHAPASLCWWYESMPDEHHNTIYHPATLRALRLMLGADDA